MMLSKWLFKIYSLQVDLRVVPLNIYLWSALSTVQETMITLILWNNGLLQKRFMT